MGIKIKNLRISPYTDKDGIKVIFGDELHLSFEIPHVDGESYLCALDNERILYPINRPVCAYTSVFTRDGDDVDFTLKLTTSKLRDYVSSIRKPMPVWLQIVREVNGKYETVLLDDILAIPSVIDGNMTVYEGDSFKELLDGKMDVPEAQGTAGQVLTMDADGHYSWQDAQTGEGNVQSDWDCSDSESDAFILNKPNLATVATSGSYNDLTDKPEIPEQTQADWDESDSSATDYIKHKPTLFSGDYNDLTNKPNLANVATSGSYNDLTDKPIITQPVNADWDESDSENLAYIFNKPNLATVATSGSYTDLTNKPVIQTQYDWLCLTAKEANSTVRLDKVETPPEIDLEYSTDGITWTAYTWTNTTGATITLANNGKVYWRGDNANLALNYSFTNLYKFVMSGTIEATGNIMSLLSKTCSKTEVPSSCFSMLFYDCTALTKADILYGIKSTVSGCQGIFRNCTGLTSVELPNIEIPNTGSYAFSMAFNGCSNLARVKVGFHTWQMRDSSNWLNGVAANGVFICPSDLPIVRGTDRIPTGWEVEFESAPQSDWSQSDSTEASYIKNKPTLATVATTGSYNDLSNTPVIPDITDYLCFTAQASNSTVSLVKEGNPYEVTLEYSVDRHNWTAYSFGTVITLANRGDYVCFRGDNPNGFNNSTSQGSNRKYKFVMTGTIAASGNIMSLISKQCKDLALVSYEFEGLFYGCTSLVEAPELPATTLNTYCYEQMFLGCTSLKKVPDFVVTDLVQGCFAQMFYGCTSLTEAPELPATTLAKSCYSGMFHGCTSLTKAPELPATTLAQNCYKEMFMGCTSLVEAPELPAMTLANDCYSGMFRQCTSLTEAPELPAMTLANYCYSTMFAECTSLKYAPELPATNTSPSMCYQSMFGYCTSLQYLKVGFSSWSGTTYRWLQNVSATGLFVCPVALNTTVRDDTYVPSGWSVTNGANNASADTTSEVDASSVSNYTVCVGTKQTGVVTVDTALTLNALPNESTEIAYAEIVLDVAANATVTAGTNITFVDTPTAGKRNVCVVRWADQTAKLYVTITEDIPQA